MAVPIASSDTQPSYRHGCTHGHAHGGRTYTPLVRRAYAERKWRDKTPVSGDQRRRMAHHRECARTPRTLAYFKRAFHRQRIQHARERKHQLELQRLRRESRCGTPGCNRKLARAELRLSDSEYRCADSLYQHESGWEETARNPSSGAYGIPQALPPGKMGSAAQGSGWRAALAQLRWGKSYVDGRYGGYCGAWGFWLSHSWY